MKNSDELDKIQKWGPFKAVKFGSYGKNSPLMVSILNGIRLVSTLSKMAGLVKIENPSIDQYTTYIQPEFAQFLMKEHYYEFLLIA
jgi:hypothetical protein